MGVGRGPPRPFLVIVSGEWPQQPRGGLRGSAWVLVVSVEVPQEKGTQLAEQTQRPERAPARPTASLPGSSWSAAEEAQAHCALPLRASTARRWPRPRAAGALHRSLSRAPGGLRLRERGPRQAPRLSGAMLRFPFGGNHCVFNQTPLKHSAPRCSHHRNGLVGSPAPTGCRTPLLLLPAISTRERDRAPEGAAWRGCAHLIGRQTGSRSPQCPEGSDSRFFPRPAAPPSHARRMCSA